MLFFRVCPDYVIKSVEEKRLICWIKGEETTLGQGEKKKEAKKDDIRFIYSISVESDGTTIF